MIRLRLPRLLFQGEVTSDNNIFLDDSAGSYTATLPSATANAGVELFYIRKNSSANTITFAASAGSILGGVTSLSR